MSLPNDKTRNSEQILTPEKPEFISANTLADTKPIRYFRQF